MLDSESFRFFDKEVKVSLLSIGVST